ncbi:J domain-containing protein [Chloroflexota bacterium]
MHQFDELEGVNRKIQELLTEFQRLSAGRMERLARSAVDPLLQRLMQEMNMDWTQAQQPPKIDPYKIIGLEQSASDEEVKKRYLELAHILHPDKSGTPATAHFFQLVKEAFRMIEHERNWNKD